jgi:hypothetical protein
MPKNRPDYTATVYEQLIYLTYKIPFVYAWENSFSSLKMALCV